MERVSDRAGASRRRLLQAAAEELIASGDVEVAAVARRAGMSTGLPYHYFGTRSGLMSALLEDFYERLIADTVLGHYEGATWLERWRAQVATWVEHMYADPLAPVVLGRMVGDARVAALEAQCFKRVIDLGAKHFAASQAEGHVAERSRPGAPGRRGGRRHARHPRHRPEPEPAPRSAGRDARGLAVHRLRTGCHRRS
ncbi:TetR/AcrR family transcriptional regulator [Nonomuraea ferruginea]